MTAIAPGDEGDEAVTEARAAPGPRAATATEIKAQIEAEREGGPFLVYRDEDGEQRLEEIEPGAGELWVGRGEGARLRLPWDAQVSSLHARIEVVGTECTLIDDGISRNGSFVNGERVRGRWRLREGDVLRFGRTEVLFRAPDQVGADGTTQAADEHTVEQRAFAAVLFTDIVGSTERAAELGDRRWRELLDRHDELGAEEIDRCGGRLITTTGDGLVAAFDAPARAIECGRAISAAAEGIGVELRAGVHAGECEVRGENLGGIAVHIGARVAAEAGPGEMLVTGTVKDIVLGSGISFEERGSRQLRGVPGEWPIYAVAPGEAASG